MVTAMAEEKNEVIFDDGKINQSQEFRNPDDLYRELIDHVRKYHPSDDISMIEKAYRVAYEAHKNQFRKSGEPYIIHPLNVAWSWIRRPLWRGFSTTWWRIPS